MSHNLEYITDASLSALTIRPRARKDKAPLGTTEARITRLGGFAGSDGIRIKISSVHGGPQRAVDIRGEDLYALREFLAELPEEAFVRPADPIKKPERWTDGDVITWIPSTLFEPRAYRRIKGEWVSGLSVVADKVMEIGVRDWPESYRVVRQASGQDL